MGDCRLDPQAPKLNFVPSEASNTPPFSTWLSRLFAKYSVLCFFRISIDLGPDICQRSVTVVGQCQVVVGPSATTELWRAGSAKCSCTLYGYYFATFRCIECKHHSPYGRLHFSLSAFVSFRIQANLAVRFVSGPVTGWAMPSGSPSATPGLLDTR